MSDVKRVIVLLVCFMFCVGALVSLKADDCSHTKVDPKASCPIQTNNTQSLTCLGIGQSVCDGYSKASEIQTGPFGGQPNLANTRLDLIWPQACNPVDPESCLPQSSQCYFKTKCTWDGRYCMTDETDPGYWVYAFEYRTVPC